MATFTLENIAETGARVANSTHYEFMILGPELPASARVDIEYALLAQGAEKARQHAIDVLNADIVDRGYGVVVGELAVGYKVT